MIWTVVIVTVSINTAMEKCLGYLPAVHRCAGIYKIQPYPSY